jgi:hydrophobic/amphiphilic exporter-1 (mainly G- bacteria), HAE1 family
MSLTQTAVNRPVTVAMLFIGIAVLGLLSLNKISIDFLPAIKTPELMVQTVYTSASPEEIEKQVSEPIESILGTVSGIKHISSISREGLSLVRLKFNWGLNIDYTMLEVREKLDAVRSFLPSEAERPTILRIDPSTESIITVSLSTNKKQHGVIDAARQSAELAQLHEFAQILVKRRLEQIQGIAQAVVAGGHEREINVWVNPDKLAAFGLQLQDVSAALERANIQFSGGTLKQGVFRYAFRTLSELETLADIEQVALTTSQNRLIQLRNIAEVQEGFIEQQGLTRVNGREAVLLFIRKEAGANTVQVSEEAHRILHMLALDYPDVSFTVLFDQAEFIRKSISDIEQAIFWGAVLAFLVLFLFLADPRYPLLIGIVTPFSILTTVVMMYFSNITFNIISLTGLALGIGMVGDNAIIIVENFSRLRQSGVSVRDAVLQGARELNVTVSAATLTNVAIFLPVVFVHGVAQKLFLHMSLTMTFSLLASLLVAVTLVPALLDRMPEQKKKIKPSRFSLLYDSWKEKYLVSLQWCLHHRVAVLALTTALALLAVMAAFFIPAEQAPDIDQSRFTIELIMPRGSALEAVSSTSALVENILLSLPSIAVTAADIGISSREDYFSLLFADLDRSRIEVKVRPGFTVNQAIEDSRAAMQSLQRQLTDMGASLAFKQRATTFARIIQPAENDIEIRIIGKDLSVSAEIARQINARAQSVSGLTDLRLALQQNNPEMRVRLLRDQLAIHHLQAGQVVEEVSGFLRGQVATYISDFDQRTPVRVRPAVVAEMDKKNALLHHSLTGGIPVSEVVRIEDGLGYNEIYHDNHQRAVLLYANAGHRNILGVVDELKQNAAGMVLPAGYEIQVGGKIDEIRDAFSGLLIIIMLSLFLVYMILASEYESILYPLVILMTSPLSVVGAFLFMFLAGQSYNIMSIVGLVIMLGAIDNDTVIALDLIIDNRRQNMGLHEAVLDGMSKRLRPIIMTALTTLLGIIPLLIGFGAGLELAAALSWPVLGGILASTLVAMFVDPVLYTYFDRFHKHR